MNHIDKVTSVHDTNNLEDRNKVIKECKEKEKLIKQKSDKDEISTDDNEKCEWGNVDLGNRA